MYVQNYVRSDNVRYLPLCLFCSTKLSKLDYIRIFSSTITASVYISYIPYISYISFQLRRRHRHTRLALCGEQLYESGRKVVLSCHHITAYNWRRCYRAAQSLTSEHRLVELSAGFQLKYEYTRCIFKLWKFTV